MKRILVFVIATGLILEGCCDKDFIIPTADYDFRDGAIDVTSIISSSCSGNQTPDYTTVGATPDGSAGSCWSNGGPLHNVWFKFKAPVSENGTILVFVGGSFGTQRRTLLALWDTDGTTQRDCSTFGNDDDIVSIYDGNWTAGEYYYFSVDVQDSQSVGTFSLCLTDTD
jgi:hypothetical protein